MFWIWGLRLGLKVAWGFQLMGLGAWAFWFFWVGALYINVIINLGENGAAVNDTK